MPRIDALEVWCWRRLLRVLGSNQTILKEISPEYSLEGLKQKLKPQYFGHFMQRANSLEKTRMLGKLEGKRRWGQQRTKWLDGITSSTDMTLSKLWGAGGAGSEGQGSLACCSAWGCKELDTVEQLNNNNNET